MKKKELTGYASIDNPQNIGATYLERNPIIPNTNVYTLLKLISMKHLGDDAVSCWGLRAQYAKLLDDSASISLALKELGVKKGDIIAVAMPNLYQALVMFFACNRIGAVTTYLDPFSPKHEIVNYLNLFESPILVTYGTSDDFNREIKFKTSVKHIITLNKDKVNVLNLSNDYRKTSNKDHIDFNSLGSVAEYKKFSFEPLHSKKEDSLILFTSGSTGKPKSVVLTNENIIAAEMYAMNTSHTENIKATRTLTCVPFSYPYGFVTSALTSLLWGKETVLAPDISKYTIAYYYTKCPNIVFGSPALLDLTMKYVPNYVDLSSVTHFISGGDFLTLAQAKRATEFFKFHGATNIQVGNGFGNAETVSIGSTPVGVPLRQDTAGKILVGTNVMIVDPETMKEKKYNEEGLLLVSGKHVFKGYYKNEKLTSEVKININNREYYNTGTLGFVDERGYFTPTGRQSRFYINASLNKIYCDKVQGIISNLAFVDDCAVVKVPDEENLYVNKAYVVLKDSYLPTSEMNKLINDLLYTPIKLENGTVAQLKDYEVPTYIEFISSLPRIPGAQKIDYKFLEDDALAKLGKSKVKTLK